jgi:hypothetical protein
MSDEAATPEDDAIDFEQPYQPDEDEETGAPEESPAEESSPSEPERKASSDEFDHDADLNLQSALRLIAAAGIPEDGIEMYAASHGDFERLSDSLRGNKDRDLILRLVKSSYDAFRHGEERKAARIASEIEEFAGGKKAWNDMRKWAESNASPEELADMKAAIEMGGPAARLLVRLLKQVRSAPKAEAEDTEEAEELRKPRASRREREVLTPAVINRRIGDLYAKYGTAATRTPEYRALMNAIN